ncbi:MAG: isochorismate synthase, partial [Planctomycetota bacterium]|nr:isochorismate synthase [Planctomycetota bacterium]
AVPLQVLPLEEENAWHQRVNAVSDAARATYLDKVVLARAVEFHPGEQSFDRNQTLLKLRAQHPNSVTFAISRGGSCFLGSTPETLIHLNKGVFETHALAGTIKRSDDPKEDEKAGQALLQSSKDRQEQNIVTKALIKALQPLSRELQVAEPPKLRHLPNVLHLETKLSGQLVSDELFQSSHVFTLLSHMHPTPAVGGHPFGRARQWLEDREALQRGWYAGPIGWIDGQGNGTFAVAIRSALLSDDRVLAYAGAGIVADSKPGLEWQETAVKFETIRSALILKEKTPSHAQSSEPKPL